MPKPRSEPFVFGGKVRVDFFLSPTGQCPARKFLNGLPNNHKAKVAKIIEYFSEHGKTSNPDYCKALKGKKASGFHEFRDIHISQTRFFFFYINSYHIVITHGCPKKRNDTDQAEIDKMIEIKKTYENKPLYEE
jgi:phage-related protein